MCFSGTTHLTKASLMTLKRTTSKPLNQKAANGLQFLNSEEIDRIHTGALTLLEKVGLAVESREAADIFHGNGAGVEKGNGFFKVKMPSHLVEDCIGQAPKEITYYGREEKNDYTYRGDGTVFAAFGQCVNIQDPATGIVRPSTKADIEASAKLQDALPFLITAALIQPVDSGGTPPAEEQPTTKA